jgi:hypothetical protein
VISGPCRRFRAFDAISADPSQALTPNAADFLQAQAAQAAQRVAEDNAALLHSSPSSTTPLGGALGATPDTIYGSAHGGMEEGDEAETLLMQFEALDDGHGAFVFICNNDSEAAFTYMEPFVFGATKNCLKRQEMDVIERGTPLWVFNRVAKTLFGPYVASDVVDENLIEPGSEHCLGKEKFGWCVVVVWLCGAVVLGIVVWCCSVWHCCLVLLCLVLLSGGRFWRLTPSLSLSLSLSFFLFVDHRYIEKRQCEKPHSSPGVEMPGNGGRARVGRHGPDHPRLGETGWVVDHRAS